jgi:deoxycytidylate deaminase
MKFTGDFEALKARLAGLDGDWTEPNPNQVQFRDRAGAVMSWYPSTGTIHFQGKAQSAQALENLVAERLAIATALLGQQPVELQAQEAVIPGDPGEQQQTLPPAEVGSGDSELVLAVVGATGTDLDQVTQVLEERLRTFRYVPEVIKISRDIIPDLRSFEAGTDHFSRTNALMDAGNALRQDTGDNSVLALAASARIRSIRRRKFGDKNLAPLPRQAFILSSLKHPEEVHRLRDIYSTGFFVIGVHADKTARENFLIRNKRLTEEQAERLMERDAEEIDTFGQHTRDTFHLSDFFISLDDSRGKLQGDLWRVLDLIFGKPYVTPTFDEYAMFMAFSAALRSADLSRQVGAVVAQHRNIVATGANDVPRAGGGLYWPDYNRAGNEIDDWDEGRDYKRGFDSNAREKRAMIDEIVAAVAASDQEALRDRLRRTKLNDITEYGRMVHAEMEAILACSRMGISTRNATLYCTTFPCHNCAKHIIAAGITRVVYVEPYPKSKARDFHSDSVSFEIEHDDKVVFAPFVGVGPRSFFDLFSMRLGSGQPLERKTFDGGIVAWDEQHANLRMQMLPTSYIDRETLATDLLEELLEQPHE